jgi:hypothetical protein
MLGPYRFDTIARIKGILVDLSKAHISMMSNVLITNICTIKNGKIDPSITDPQVKNIYFECTFISVIDGHNYDIVTNGEVWYQPHMNIELILGLGDKKAISHAISRFADLMEIDN